MERRWFIVDAHQHIEVGSYIYASQMPKETAEEKLRKEASYFKEWFNRYGVAYGAVSNISPMVDSIGRRRHGGNEVVVELAKQLDGKVVGQYVPNVFEHPDVVREKTEEAIKELRFKGIKLHPWVSAFPLNHPIVYPVFDVAAKYRVPILSHSSRSEFCTPVLFADIATRYPEVPIIMGHMGKQHLHYDVLPVMRLAENIYLETSGSKIQILLEKAVKEFGAERVLFGTDGPHELLRAYVTRIEDLDVSEEDKELILGKNAAELFKLPKP
ncbi:MAG: amidohydrolase family protein [Candidatus Bathyarchaeia archaeon]